MKKILHFIDSGGLYGAENVLLNLSREMLKHGDFTPIVGCIVQSPKEENVLFDQAESYGIKAEKMVINNKKFFIDLFSVAWKIKKMGIGCIHSHGYKPSVAGFIIRCLTGVKVISTCHLWYMGGKRGFKQRAMIRLELFFYRFFPRVVAVSEPIKEFLVLSGVNEKKITVIKNGIYLEDYAVAADAPNSLLRNKLCTGNDTFVFVNIARLTAQKAQDIIITAARELKKQCVDCVFLLLGDGPLAHEYEQLIKEYRVADYVKMLGFQHNVAEWLSLADAYLLPSRDEGLPMGLLEAMAARKPVIVTPVGNIPFLIEHKKTGLIVAVDDVNALVEAVLWMIENPSLCRKISRRAFDVVEKEYSARSMYAMYKNIYEEVCR